MCRVMEEVREEGRIEGREEGRKEGRIEGREEGRKEGRVEGFENGVKETRVRMIDALLENISADNLLHDVQFRGLGITQEEINAARERMDG